MFFNFNTSTAEDAIKSGNLKKLQKLVDATNCNVPGDSERPPLYYAILYKKPEIAAWLLSLGCDVESGAEKPDQYVMEFVVRQLSEPLLKVFVEHGEAQLSYIDGMPVLHTLICEEGISESYFSYVMSLGADINTIDMRATQETVLAYYVGQEKIRVDTLIVAWLIGLGADVNKAQSAKHTPLMQALMNPALLDAQTKLGATTFPNVLEKLSRNGDLELNLPVKSPCFCRTYSAVPPL